MYKVMYWEQKKGTHSKHKELNKAKKVCRELGHTGEHIPFLKGYPPIAFVADKNNFVCYNPRFKKEERKMTIKLNDTGIDTKKTFNQICDEIEDQGEMSPREMGYTENETVFVSASYARLHILPTEDRWDIDAPYWYIS